MTRSVIVPQRRRDLLGRERHHTFAGIDVDVELIEEVAPEETVAHVRRQDARAHGHASDAGLTDLDAVDPIGKMGNAVIVDPAVDLSVGRCWPPEHQKKGYEEPCRPSHGGIIPHSATGDTRPFPLRRRPRFARAALGKSAGASPCSRPGAGTMPGK